MKDGTVRTTRRQKTVTAPTRQHVVWQGIKSWPGRMTPGLPDIRSGKVLQIRRELAEGTYDINGRLTVAVDRLLESLVGKAGRN